MKRKNLFLLLIVFLLLITGCNEDKEKKEENAIKSEKCSVTKTSDGMKYTAKYEIIPKDDKYVKSVKTIEILEIDDEEELQNYKKIIENQLKTSNELYGGYTYKSTINKNVLTVTCEIDYDKLDLKKYLEDTPSASIMIDDTYKATIKGVKSVYKQLGASCE